MTNTGVGRMRRPSWRDPRLGVGILLVVASVALGSWAVARADSTVEVYQADTALTAGETLEVEDLRVVQIRLDGVEDAYLVPGADLHDAVITRTVGAGELVPLTSIGTAQSLQLRPVQIPMSMAMTDIVSPGTRVDLWVAMPDPAVNVTTLLPPELLVADVEVREVHEDTSVFAGSNTAQVQVLVHHDDLPDVLAAIAAEGEITVVPVLGGGVG